MADKYWQDVLDEIQRKKTEKAIKKSNRRTKKAQKKTYRQKSKTKHSARERKRHVKKEKRSRKQSKWNAFRKRMYKSYGYLCKVCRQRGKLHVHHLVPRSVRPDWLYNVENCICLCEKCHMELPSSNKNVSNYQEEWKLILSPEEIVSLESWIEGQGKVGFSVSQYYYEQHHQS